MDGGGVVPTVNGFDMGDSRATTLILYSLSSFAGYAEGGGTLSASDHKRPEHHIVVPIYPEQIGTVMPTFNAKNYSNHQEVHQGSVTVFRSHGFTKWTEETDAYGTLRSSGSKQADVDLVMPHVRRLMPIECERLQGFPDNWTAGQADTPRYKQMGNAVAVPVVEWILRRITDIETTHNDA